MAEEFHPHFCDCLICMGGIPAEATLVSLSPVVAAGAVERARHLASLRAAAARQREQLRELRALLRGATP
jgi:hypothetical protein